jgi:glutaredoxin
MLTVYTKNNCGFCMMAKALLNKHDMAYQEVNIEDDEDLKMFMISQGHITMPQIYQDDEIFVEGGFQGLKEHLDKETIDTTQLGEI